METRCSARPFALFSLLAALGCLGQVKEVEPEDPDDPGGPDGCNPGGSFASARLSLLTDDQYVHVVRDVFGVIFEGDVSTARNASGEYGLVESGAVSTPALAQVYLRAADQVAAKIKPWGPTRSPPAAWRRSCARGCRWPGAARSPTPRSAGWWTGSSSRRSPTARRAPCS